MELWESFPRWGVQKAAKDFVVNRWNMKKHQGEGLKPGSLCNLEQSCLGLLFLNCLASRISIFIELPSNQMNCLASRISVFIELPSNQILLGMEFLKIIPSGNLRSCHWNMAHWEDPLLNSQHCLTEKKCKSSSISWLYLWAKNFPLLQVCPKWFQKVSRSKAVTCVGGEASSPPVSAKTSHTHHRVRMSEGRKTNTNITVKHYIKILLCFCDRYF